ncbi:hypothetical protein BH11MYX1_BH11MYX1_43980 [soil metagenome]
MSFREFVGMALDDAGVAKRVATEDCTVLERPAAEGEPLAWFYCRDQSDLNEIANQLRAGSAVSFFFDDRIEALVDSDTTRSIITTTCADHEIALGALGLDGLRIEMSFARNAEEVALALPPLDDGAQLVFFGAFPGRDNDGTWAITLTLPEVDGVVREPA